MTDNAPYINIHTHQRVVSALSICTIGVHPYSVEESPVLQRCDITDSIEAIGEIGLDFSREIDQQRQESYFVEQLKIAEEYSLPVVIHSVRAFERTLEILDQFCLRAVILHGFIGSPQQAQRATSKGYYLSFGHRCFSSPKSLKALAVTSIDRLFFETDDNPTSIEEIYQRAAAYREESLEQIKKAIYNNYLNIFKKQ